jgi:hypothetical protein
MRLSYARESDEGTCGVRLILHVPRIGPPRDPQADRFLARLVVLVPWTGKVYYLRIRLLKG